MVCNSPGLPNGIQRSDEPANWLSVRAEKPCPSTVTESNVLVKSAARNRWVSPRLSLVCRETPPGTSAPISRAWRVWPVVCQTGRNINATNASQNSPFSAARIARRRPEPCRFRRTNQTCTTNKISNAAMTRPFSAGETGLNSKRIIGGVARKRVPASGCRCRWRWCVGRGR